MTPVPDELRAAEGNRDQVTAWNTGEGTHWSTHDDQYNRTIRRHHLRLLEAADVASDERVLDIGCGCGETTRDAARAAISGHALGVDVSAPMLERARERTRAEGLTNVSFLQADAQVEPFDGDAFDLAISRFGAMFFAEPDAAFANIARALRRDGRLVIVAWRTLVQNEWLTRIRDAVAVGRDLPQPPVGAPGPFAFAEPDGTRQMFERAGFEEVEFVALNEPVCLGVDTDDAYGFISENGFVVGMLKDLAADDQARALDELRTLLAAHDTGDGVLLGSGAWLISARVGRR
jgi:SAM-dependent methyltransferase